MKNEKFYLWLTKQLANRNLTFRQFHQLWYKYHQIDYSSWLKRIKNGYIPAEWLHLFAVLLGVRVERVLRAVLKDVRGR